jgi:hypothetical protein
MQVHSKREPGQEKREPDIRMQLQHVGPAGRPDRASLPVFLPVLDQFSEICRMLARLVEVV